jgi:hypothetical protein
MKMETNFKVIKIGREYAVIQTTERRMDNKEFILESSKLGNDLMQLNQQILKAKVSLESKEAEKALEEAVKNKDKLIALQGDWDVLMEDELKLLSKAWRKKIKEEKVRLGYKNDLEDNKKILLQNQILAGIVSIDGFSMNHPLVLELKKDFGNI